MQTKERVEERARPREPADAREPSEAAERPGPVVVDPERPRLDARTLLALQRTAGNAAVNRLVQETRAREAEARGNGAGPRRDPSHRFLSPFIDAFERVRKSRSLFGKLADAGGRAVAAGGSFVGKALDFVRRAGQRPVVAGTSVFGKAFGAAKGAAGKAFAAVKGGAQKVVGGAKAVGSKAVAGAKKVAEGPKSFFEMILAFARAKLGLGAKEAREALADKDEPGGGRAGGRPGAAPQVKDKAPRGGAGSASPASARGSTDGGGGAGGGGPAGPGADVASPSLDGAEPGADGAERPKTPDEDPRFLAFKGQTQVKAAKAKAHAPAEAKAAEAQGAAKGPPNEVASQAKGAQVDEMAAQKPGTFDKKAFIDAVKKAVEAASPKNLKEATEFSKSGKAGEVRDQVAGMVTQNKETAESAIKEKTEAEPDPSKGEPKEVVPMAAEAPGARPGPVGAAAAMPPPATAAEVDLASGPAKIEKELADNEVTEEQLRESNEPEMLQAVDAKKEAEKHSAEAPAAYRREEADILAGAKGDAQQTAEADLEDLHTKRVGSLAQVAGSKTKTKSADEAKRAQVAGQMETIYGKTKADVTKILDGIEPKVTAAFETGEKGARQAFETYVGAQMSAYKEKRYSGWRGKLRWFRDKFLGLPDAVNKFYEQGKNQYLAAMDAVISRIADIVGTDLTAARARIAQGQAEIQKYVASLPKDLKKVGKDAAEEIGERFTQLESDVDSKQEELVSTIANKYVESRGELDKRIEELKEANKGLVDKAIGFVKGVIDTVRKLKDLLMTVLRKAISVIGHILAHPIRFIENFMSGVKDGLNLFRDKIEDYLEGALVGWLFGPSVLGGQKIEKPESLDFKGVVSLVLQVLGLTKDAILDLLRTKVGAPAVEKLKQGVEWVGLLVTEGPAGLWKWIQEKVGDLYDTVLGAIKDFVITRIIRAGITWLISLLNPAGALVRIVKAIVDVVTFIFERAEQLADFINSILDAVIAVAKGETAGVAKRIADGLGKGLTMALGFLASLLGLGGIGETIRGIVDKVRAPVKRVVNGLIDGAVRTAKRLWGGVKAFGKKALHAGKRAVGKGREAGKAALNWLKGKIGLKRFKAGGERHSVYMQIVAGAPKVMIASTPTDVLTFLATFEAQRVNRLPAGPQKDQLVDAIGIARGLAGQLPAELSTIDLPKAGPGPPARLLARIDGLAQQLQRILVLATRGVHTGAHPQDPIPIDFYKSMRRYERIRLNVNGTEQWAWPHEVTSLPVPMELEAMADSGGEVRIGVDQEYQPETMRDRRKPMRRTEEGAETEDARETMAVRDFRTLLARFGFNWTGLAGDHVHDMALGGYDGKENLWPLDYATNNASNAVYRQEVVYRESETNEVRTATVGELRGKWFVIVRIV